MRPRWRAERTPASARCTRRHRRMLVAGVVEVDALLTKARAAAGVQLSTRSGRATPSGAAALWSTASRRSQAASHRLPAQRVFVDDAASRTWTGPQSPGTPALPDIAEPASDRPRNSREITQPTRRYNGRLRFLGSTSRTVARPHVGLPATRVDGGQSLESSRRPPAICRLRLHLPDLWSWKAADRRAASRPGVRRAGQYPSTRLRLQLPRHRMGPIQRRASPASAGEVGRAQRHATKRWISVDEHVLQLLMARPPRQRALRVWANTVCFALNSRQSWRR